MNLFSSSPAVYSWEQMGAVTLPGDLLNEWKESSQELALCRESGKRVGGINCNSIPLRVQALH